MPGSASATIADGRRMNKQEIKLQGKRITLTPLNFENIYRHFEWNNDPELNRLDSEFPFERESFADFKARFEQMVDHPSPHNIDLEIHAEDGVLIGLAYVTDISHHNKHCMIGITIGDRNYWGKGYGRESIELLLAYCFDQLGMHRVHTETFEYNEAWRSLVRDAGFIQEGVERDYLYRDGEFWDKEIYSLLEDEYRRPKRGKAA